MQRVGIVVPLKKGSEERAAELLSSGPPLDLEAEGFERHAVYLTSREVVFVFEGPEPEWRIDELVDDPLHPVLQDALEEWRELVDGRPRPAWPVYFWEREGGDAAHGPSGS
jgi:hypothetical protein